MANDLAEIPESQLCLQLIEVGNNIKDLPPSDNGVLAVLENAEDILSLVGQEPSQAIRDALRPITKALATYRLFKHDNMDIKISVLYCIHELARIAAPDAPCCNNCMKAIFQHTIENVFGKLSSLSGRSFVKAMEILDTVSKVKSSLILLDLNCTALIRRMFQLFLDTIEPNHPEAMFSNMENIMTCLLQESDEITLDLLKPLFEAVNNKNQVISTPSERLATKVLRNCSEIVRPYLMEQVEQMRKILMLLTIH